MSYGVYPIMMLSAAREAYIAAKRELGEGRDPMAARKAEKQADTMTVKAVAEQWFKHRKPSKTEKHASEVWRRLELDILPTLGNTPVNDLTAAQVRDCIKAIVPVRNFIVGAGTVGQFS